MKKFTGCIIFLFFIFCGLRAQSNHFIYIQSDNKQPFYIRVKDKVFSSTESGYVIIPKVEEGQLAFILGFPKNKWSSINYNLEIDQKDLGLQLKKVDSLTWALYNIQTSELLSAAESNTVSTAIIQNYTDEFSNVLAEVSNTPSVKQKKIITDTSNTSKSVPVKEAFVAKTNEIAIKPVETKTDSTVKNIIVKNEVVQEKLPGAEALNFVRSVISNEFSLIDNTGRSLTYKVKDGDKEETVVIFISYEKDIAKALEQKKLDESSKTAQHNNADEGQKKEEATMINSDSTQSLVVTNKNCTQIADQQDFIKLRRIMTQEDSEEKMIELAKAAFSSKCFSAEQVKYLAVLLLNEDNRLRFLQMSVNHISDFQNFNRLEDLITTEKNRSKFKEIQY